MNIDDGYVKGLDEFTMGDKVPTKSCPRCRKAGRKHVKPLTEFPRHAGRKDGRDGWCKECNSDRVLEWKKKRQRQRKKLLRKPI